MPYIIVVNQPGYLPESSPYAVATIEEARDAALDAVWTSEAFESVDPEPMLDAARALSEYGGTVGPLPDGYVIEVQYVGWNWVIGQAEDAGLDTDALHEEGGDLAILDAYNGQ